ncbi:GNAT family N-acetyltransferase [Thermodesulfovibrio sp. TK110]
MELEMKSLSKNEMILFLKDNNYSSTLPNKIKCFGFYNNNNLIGVAGLYKIAWHTTEIRSICVKHNERGKGVGKIIIRMLLNIIDTPLVSATVVKENVASLKVFEFNGFNTVCKFVNRVTKHELFLLIRTINLNKEE